MKSRLASIPPTRTRISQENMSALSLRSKWGPLRSLLALSPVLILAPYIALKEHYSLPKPLKELVNPQTSLPQLSEQLILSYAQHLSEEIGYRVVGTKEHALGDEWMEQKAQEIKSQCDQAIQRETGRKLECEVWRQVGSGSHRFDMMSSRLYKTYVNLTNIVVRVSDGTPKGKEHAILVNSHLDSTLPSPGAADDALSVGVMLECLRVLVNTPAWSPKHSIIFLFNNAEESLQDGSHLFSTQHPTRDTVRAVINLEAAGTRGREILFQATSEQMIEAYSHVPRPYGTVLANEVFSSGVMLSDTDFRQFEYYLNVTGLDMAVVGNSYLYHMRKDLVEHIEPGVAQNMAENTLALLEYLSSPQSPLPSLDVPFTRPTTVFISQHGMFFMYSFATAKILYSCVFLASALFVRVSFVHPTPALRQGRTFWKEQLRGTVAIVLGMIGAAVAPNIVAAIMSWVLKSGMSWFSVEFSALALYGPPAMAGALAAQLILGPVSEQTMISSLLLLQSSIALLGQLVGIGSSAIYFLSSLPLLVTLILNQFITESGHISLWTYALGQLAPLLIGTQILSAILDIFVPLTGRMGSNAPADNIIATIVAFLTCYALPLMLPFAHRFGRGVQIRFLVLLTVITTIAMAAFSLRPVFDTMHQKRLFVIHIENMTTQEEHLHIASADGAPGFSGLVQDVAHQFGRPDYLVAPEVADPYNGNWDLLYPFSTFLDMHKIKMPVDPNFVSPSSPGVAFTVSAVNDIIDREAGIRSLTLQVYHPGIIWTVIAFDAHVLEWTLDNNPPDQRARHHVREGSFYGTDSWSIDLVLKLPDDVPQSSGELVVNYIGIDEKGMWPHKKAEKESGARVLRLFEDLDNWLDVKTGGAVDAMMIGCLGGVATI